MSSPGCVAVSVGCKRCILRVARPMLVAIMLNATPALANNEALHEASPLEPAIESQAAGGKMMHRLRQPPFDVTAVGLGLICAFLGSILVFGWQDKWFAGAAAKASAGAMADGAPVGQARLPVKA